MTQEELLNHNPYCTCSMCDEILQHLYTEDKELQDKHNIATSEFIKNALSFDWDAALKESHEAR